MTRNICASPFNKEWQCQLISAQLKIINSFNQTTTGELNAKPSYHVLREPSLTTTILQLIKNLQQLCKL